MDKLMTKRRKIDVIDGKIIKLLAERMRISREIGKFKQVNDMKIKNPERERMIMKKIESHSAKFGLSPALGQKIFALLLEESRKCQKADPF